MADTSTASNSRQRLRQLIGDLLFRARRASCETESVGRLVGQTCFLDVGKARSAAAYLTELGLAGDAVRLLEDVGHLRRHADEVFQRSISPRTEPHDLEQAQRDLESLNFEASRLVVFLRELESFCVNENASPTPPAKSDDGEGKDGVGSTPADENPEGSPLAERARLVLQVLLRGEAFDSDHRMRTADIALKAAGKTADPNQYKEVIADLKGRYFIDTKEGRGGGCWLTALGRSRAEKL